MASKTSLSIRNMTRLLTRLCPLADINSIELSCNDPQTQFLAVIWNSQHFYAYPHPPSFFLFFFLYRINIVSRMFVELLSSWSLSLSSLMASTESMSCLWSNWASSQHSEASRQMCQEPKVKGQNNCSHFLRTGFHLACTWCDLSLKIVLFWGCFWLVTGRNTWQHDVTCS